MLPTQRGPWCIAKAENYLSVSQLTDAERACETTESLQERCEQTALRAWGVAVPCNVPCRRCDQSPEAGTTKAPQS